MIPQFSQLFIYSPDKSNSVCKIFISTPSLDKEQTLGRLFGIMEIESVDRGLWNTIHTLAEAMERDYYGEDNIQLISGSPNRAVSAEETFEKSIQFFNDKLIELIKGGKLANLLDKVSITLGILKERKVYFAAVGNSSAFLIHQLKSQEYRLVDILQISGSKEEKVNPFKILANIVSGEINENDSLLFCTNSLLDYLSLDKIKQTLTTQEPATAARHLKDLLMEASINTAFAGIIMKLSADPQAIRADKEIRLPQKSLDHLVITEKTTEAYLSPPLRFNLKKYSRLIGSKSKTLIVRLSIYLWQTLRHKMSGVPAAPARRVTPRPVPTVTRPLTQANTRDNETLTELPRMVGSNDLLKNLIKKCGAMIRALRQIVRPAPGRPRLSWSDVTNHLVNQLVIALKRWRALPQLSQRLLLSALVLFLLLAYSLITLAKNHVSDGEQQQFDSAIAQIEQNKNGIESALIYNDENRANTLLTQIQELRATLQTKTKDQKNTAATLDSALAALTLKLQHIIDVTPQSVAELTDAAATMQAGTFVLVKTQLYTVNLNTNEIYRIDPAAGTAQPLGVKADTPQIRAASVDGNDIIYYHAGNGLLKFTVGADRLDPMEANLANQENKVQDLAIYNHRLYVLTPGNNQIYRYNRAGNTLGAPSNWLRDGATIQNTRNLAVDGDMYLLTDSGEVKKYTAGAQQSWLLPPLVPPLTNATALWTSLDTPLLYILDPANGRLIAINKSNSKLERQYRSAELGGATDMAIDVKNRLAYILRQNTVLKFSLE
ncbi:hypothetical protein HY933_00185 [Candidatus Falkowbacteria bacterium]|nr:hypothetical protein [Candidatus Falkowbacteria bacterium]